MNAFPVIAVLPDGRQVDTCRVIAGPDGTRVYAWDAQRRTAETIAASTRQPVRAPGGWALELAEGDGPSAGTVRITRQGGCGCGHPMKSWQPPKPVRVGR